MSFAFVISQPQCADHSHQLRELLNNQAKSVHEKEDYARRFIVTEQLDSTPAFVLFETYRDRESIDRHGKEPHFQTLMEVLTEEDLLMEKPSIAYTKSTGGFDVDRKLM